jgi:hypothetical protein
MFLLAMDSSSYFSHISGATKGEENTIEINKEDLGAIKRREIFRLVKCAENIT